MNLHEKSSTFIRLCLSEFQGGQQKWLLCKESVHSSRSSREWQCLLTQSFASNCGLLCSKWTRIRSLDFWNLRFFIVSLYFQREPRMINFALWILRHNWSASFCDLVKSVEKCDFVHRNSRIFWHSLEFLETSLIGVKFWAANKNLMKLLKN